MEKIETTIIEQLRQDLIGKRVKVKGVSGVCNFFGYNDFLPNWQLQITIDRMPIPRIKISDIKILE